MHVEAVGARRERLDERAGAGADVVLVDDEQGRAELARELAGVAARDQQGALGGQGAVGGVGGTRVRHRPIVPTMRTVRVEPPELGAVDGLAYARFRPDSEPAGGVVVLHGAGSCKESHFDFARRCRAVGLDAIAFDQRGHGDSEGALGAGAVDDVARIAALLGTGPVSLRGSSMGGFMALVAGARLGAAAVVAVCPAGADQLRRGLRGGDFEFRADADGLDALLQVADERAAARALGERLLLLHAEGDERVPVAGSRELHAIAAGSRLVTVPGGHHRSVQHDGELQALSVSFIARAPARPSAPGAGARAGRPAAPRRARRPRAG